MTLLRVLRQGASARLIGPCLDIYAAAADSNPVQRDGLHTEMFEAAEWIQGSVTARQISLAAARLASSSGDPKLVAAIRAQQDAQQKLETLYQKRDQLAEQARDASRNTDLAVVDKDIAATSAALQQAAMAEQALVPNYGQLVQQAVSVASVLERLRPDEAFFGVTSTPSHTWLFLLHAGRIVVAQSELTDNDMAGLVRKVRDSIIPGPDALPPFAMAQAGAIYGATLGHVAAAMDDVHELVIAPSGALLALPFALLPTGPANANDLAHAPWLIRKVSLAYVPTAGNFVGLRKAEGTSTHAAHGSVWEISGLPACHRLPLRSPARVAAPVPRHLPGCLSCRMPGWNFRRHRQFLAQGHRTSFWAGIIRRRTCVMLRLVITGSCILQPMRCCPLICLSGGAGHCRLNPTSRARSERRTAGRRYYWHLAS